MKLFVVSLGCDKNLCDTEHMLYDISNAGVTICDDEYEADVILINTCSFIADAMEESINTIIEMGNLKEEGKLKKLIVTGCLAERFTEEIKEQLPEVDVILGTNSCDRILEALEVSSDEAVVIKDSQKGLFKTNGRLLTGTGFSANLKIAEGCNKRCTYCAIPLFRGSYRSVPMEELIKEAKQLAIDGVKELNIVAQETTIYGTDLYGKKRLPELLEELSKIDGIHWIRLLYAYPEEITDELIDVMATNPKICHYLDMPLQHCEDEILKNMGRRCDKAGIISLIDKLRAKMPDITIRTTFICGFPGETEELHDKLLEFLKEQKLDRVGSFAYSPEDGTKAATMENQVENKIKKKWVDELMSTQYEISVASNQRMLGKKLEVLIEGKLPEDGVYIARSFRDAPSVDSYVFVESENELYAGTFVDVLVKSSNEYDLIAEVCDESSK